jgi:hypothetical protein
MSRAIKLTHIHAINWYGYNDSLQVEGNLLLAGVTGSGKSVLMDLIMTVLVGTDAAHHHFNRSATGGQSDRTVKSYCLLDTKREENGVQQYIRSAAITYIALEFSWPRKAAEEERIETWGLRIEFRNTAENQGHIKPFVVYPWKKLPLIWASIATPFTNGLGARRCLATRSGGFGNSSHPTLTSGSRAAQRRKVPTPRDPIRRSGKQPRPTPNDFAS